MRELDKIEESVNGMKMPLAYAGQFYVLREHIGFVRERLLAVREKLEATRDEVDGNDAARGNAEAATQEPHEPQEPQAPKPHTSAPDAESPR